MPRWYVMLDGPSNDLVHIKQKFAASGFTFDHKDGKDTLSAPAFEHLQDRNDVIDAGMELLASINTALRLSVVGYTGFQFHGLIEERPDGTMHRTMLAQGASFGLAGVAAVAIAGSFGKPVRSREERLVSLLGKNEVMTDLAVSMTAYPLTWGAMNTTYESAKGLMSTKASPEAKRKDRQVLIDKGWLTADQSERFYRTAGYYRHGYPKTPIKHPSPMEYAEASILIKKLFWHLVDAIEPV
jgi:hypothetical protein